jgi:hypothetical protein
MQSKIEPSESVAQLLCTVLTTIGRAHYCSKKSNRFKDFHALVWIMCPPPLHHVDQRLLLANARAVACRKAMGNKRAFPRRYFSLYNTVVFVLIKWPQPRQLHEIWNQDASGWSAMDSMQSWHTRNLLGSICCLRTSRRLFSRLDPPHQIPQEHDTVEPYNKRNEIQIRS